MRPAFTSTKEAAAFTLLVLLLLVGPVLVGKIGLPAREQSYASQGWNWGAYPWIRHEIFYETNDIDICFVGSSHVWWGVDAPYIEEKLNRQVGRKTVVRSICWLGGDYATLYFITKDLLEHRKVKMLVFADESWAAQPNPMTTVWFRFGDGYDDLKGMSFKDQIPFYFASVIGLPRNLACLVRSNLPMALSATNYYQTHYHMPNPAARLGTATAMQSFHNNIEIYSPAESYQPSTGVRSSDACIYSPESKTNFVFLDTPMPAWQMHFANRFGALAAQYSCKLVMIHVPIYADVEKPGIRERRFWPGIIQADLTMVGIPSEKLFADLSDKQVRQLFADPFHLNGNGQKYITPLITPPLLGIYEKFFRH